MTQLSSIFNMRPDPRTYEASNEVVYNKGAIGIEIELENFPGISRELKYWSVEGDGSLRNNGAEFISIKVVGKDIIKALEEFDKEVPARTTISDRCSIHIHIDSRELTVDQLKKWIVVYTVFEKVLYKYCGHNRENNVFCVPFYKASEWFDYASSMFHSSGGKASVSGAVSRCNKYHGMNIGPVRRQGSVEFRMHPGTKSIKSILNWINILLSLKKFAVESDMSYRDLIGNSTIMGQLNFMQLVFGDLFELLVYKDAERDLLDGVRLAQEIVFSEELASNKLAEGKEYSYYFKNFASTNGRKTKDLEDIKAKKLEINFETNLQRFSVNWAEDRGFYI